MILGFRYKNGICSHLLRFNKANRLNVSAVELVYVDRRLTKIVFSIMRSTRVLALPNNLARFNESRISSRFRKVIKLCFQRLFGYWLNSEWCAEKKVCSNLRSEFNQSSTVL